MSTKSIIPQWKENFKDLLYPDRQTGVLVSLFKKGDQRVSFNYRGDQIPPWEGLLQGSGEVSPAARIQEEQCGFRPDLSNTGPAAGVLERAWKLTQLVQMCFVELENTYDCVPQGFLWGVLWEYGVDGLLLRAIQSLYCRNKSLFCISSCKSDPFPVKVGLCQGCPLSSVLFIISMERISRRRSVAEGIRFSVLQTLSRLFAYDVVLLASLGRFAVKCQAAGIRISTCKSEAMVLSQKRVDCPLWVSYRESHSPKWRSSSISRSCSRMRGKWSLRLTYVLEYHQQ